MVCEHCGNLLEDGAVVCSQCGTQVNRPHRGEGVSARRQGRPERAAGGRMGSMTPAEPIPETEILPEIEEESEIEVEIETEIGTDEGADVSSISDEEAYDDSEDDSENDPA